MEFKIKTSFKPSGDQPQAISKITNNLKKNIVHQVLMGATGTGKTFTMANVIKNINKQTLIMVSNKTLAMQLYLEFKSLFPDNRVEYYVSNFDFYQPEAYLPGKDMYIGKDVKHNIELQMMRMSTRNALCTRNDVIVVSSVAAIYASQDPVEYKNSFFEIKIDEKIKRYQLIQYLIKNGFTRNNTELKTGNFSALGDIIKIAPGDNGNFFIRIDLYDDQVNEIAIVNSTTSYVNKYIKTITIFPAQDYITSKQRLQKSLVRIKAELKERLDEFNTSGQLLEAQRLKTRTEYDIDNLEEFGVCSGIENYSRHLDLRSSGEPPFNLFDYFNKDYLLIVDESHITLPQIRGMYNTDRSRKTTLAKYGFRLPSCIDNRPLSFDEFNSKINQVIYTSATPGEYESSLVDHKFIEQIIRPTGLLDPIVQIKPTENQFNKIIEEINKRKTLNERVLIITLTIKMSEAITQYLQKLNIKATYLHSELKTLERSVVLNDLRKGVYDCLVGINLLREGIDLPEVSLICILDADKQGFLRDSRSLIQIIGRVSRNSKGRVFLFANKKSAAMEQAMKETQRRREIQNEYNIKHNIIPQTIKKEIQDYNYQKSISKKIKRIIKNKDISAINSTIVILTKKMEKASKSLNFEEAARLRDIIFELKDQ